VTAFPVFARAEELGIPVMVHQAGSTRIDARMEYARPALLDAAGRHFRELRLTIAHCGLYDPVELRAKLLSVNDYAERVGAAPIPQAKLDGIMGGNYARMLGLL
jgi:dihydroorotase